MKGLNSYDFRWMLSLFGTAVGAGILFLPIKVGVWGVYPLLFMSLFAIPMIFFSHRALARYCGGRNIEEVSGENFGSRFGILITLLYFFAFYTACIMYCVGLTNTLDSLFTHQFGLEIPRAILCFFVVSVMMGVMIFSEDLVIRVCEWLVYPLCFILLAFSLYLVPQWNLGGFSKLPSGAEFFLAVLACLPILVFAFEHTPAISTFAASMARKYGDEKENKIARILLLNSGLLLFFTMFFTFSCVLSLESGDFALAKEQNIPVVSYFANKLNSPVIAYAGPLIGILAIATSFFGHYFGAREGFVGLLKGAGSEFSDKKLKIIANSVMYFSLLIFAYANPSVLGIIDTLTGPVIAFILFVLPVIGIYKIKSLAEYKNKLVDLFVLFIGIATIATAIFKML